jgi:hypothetical protein
MVTKSGCRRAAAAHFALSESRFSGFISEELVELNIEV